MGTQTNRMGGGMRPFSQLLGRKGNEMSTVAPTVSVQEAVERMRQHNVGSLLVCSEGSLRGLFTERHLALAIAERGAGSVHDPVATVMDVRVLYVTPETTVDECMSLMTEHRTRHIPVMDGDSLVGIVSIGDAVKALVDDKDFVIEQLERYITGS